jgi:hypothetical protein
LDFQDFNQGTYSKQNQEVQSFNFIPKHGSIVPKLGAGNSKGLGSGQQQKNSGKECQN